MFCIKYRSATIGATLLLRVCESDRGRGASKCAVRASSDSLTDEIVGAAVWLTKVTMTHLFRVESDGVAPACARAGAGTFSGMLVRLREWFLRRREFHDICHLSLAAVESSKQNKYMYIHIHCVYIIYTVCLHLTPDPESTKLRVA